MPAEFTTPTPGATSIPLPVAEGVTVTVSVWAEFGSVMEIWLKGWIASASMPETADAPVLLITGGIAVADVTLTSDPP